MANQHGLKNLQVRDLDGYRHEVACTDQLRTTEVEGSHLHPEYIRLTPVGQQPLYAVQRLGR